MTEQLKKIVKAQQALLEQANKIINEQSKENLALRHALELSYDQRKAHLQRITEMLENENPSKGV